MSTPMSKRNLWMLRGVVTLVLIGVVSLLGWLFLPPSFGTFVSVAHPDYLKDMSDPRVLVGSSQDVFIGEVIAKQGQARKRGWVETQYKVKVLEVFKGSLSGDVTVNRHGGYDRWTRTVHLVDGAPNMPEPGKSYLFATRSNSVEDWHTFAPGYGELQVLDNAHADEQRWIFTDAVENEIVSIR